MITLLAGCATTPKTPQDAFDFRLNGRIGVRSAETSFSASFSWTQMDDHYHIELWGPLGASRIRLTGNPQRLSVTTPSGTATGIDPDALMLRELGWSVPINALQYWVRGLPGPGTPPENPTRDEAGYLQSFDQYGWQLHIANRHPSASSEPLPGRVIAKRGKNRIIVVCRAWQFPSNP